MLCMCFVQYPLTAVGQRSFLMLKPPQVKRMREKDRMTCGCSHHENLRMAIFYFLLMSRRVHERCPCPEDAPCRTRGEIPSSCHELMEFLLCDKAAGATRYTRACVEGSYTVCAGGPGGLPLCEKERRMDGCEVRKNCVLAKYVSGSEYVLKTCGYV